MDYNSISSLDSLEEALHNNPLSLVYFSHQQCNVCKVLKPKVRELIANNYPKVALFYVDTVKHPEVAGQFSVFAVPTILVFLEEKEYIRESRHINLSGFSERIEKLYKIYFE
ncbi:MAG: thioredoxin family protein [Bacteroidota bacterium]